VVGRATPARPPEGPVRCRVQRGRGPRVRFNTADPVLLEMARLDAEHLQGLMAAVPEPGDMQLSVLKHRSNKQSNKWRRS